VRARANVDRTTGFLDPNEALPDDQRAAHLTGVLKRTVEICWETSAQDSAKLEESGLKLVDIQSLEDLLRIPITSKKEPRRRSHLRRRCTSR
jgi:phenylacetate-coenzyme A ligase PaaK-like adenylate-forming protein